MGEEDEKTFEWTSVEETCFNLLKMHISRALLESHPRFDLPFCTQTDAFNYGLGGFIYQVYKPNS